MRAGRFLRRVTAILLKTPPSDLEWSNSCFAGCLRSRRFAQVDSISTSAFQREPNHLILTATDCRSLADGSGRGGPHAFPTDDSLTTVEFGVAVEWPKSI